MTSTQARAFISVFTKADTFPTLTSGEIDHLLALARRADTYGIAPDTYGEWVASTAYALGALVVPSTRNTHYYKVTVAGVSGGTEPTWPTTSGGTVTDGGVTWEEQGAANWVPTWNLAHAVARGWELKAGAVVGAYDIGTGAQRMSRSQMHKHCLEQAKLWRSRSFESIELVGSLRNRNGSTVNESNASDDCGGCGWWGCGGCRSVFAWPSWDAWSGWYASNRC